MLSDFATSDIEVENQDLLDEISEYAVKVMEARGYSFCIHCGKLIDEDRFADDLDYIDAREDGLCASCFEQAKLVEAAEFEYEQERQTATVFSNEEGF